MTPGKWSCHVKLTNVSLIIDKRRIENLTNETLRSDERQTIRAESGDMKYDNCQSETRRSLPITQIFILPLRST